jgi:hypothetical protein
VRDPLWRNARAVPTLDLRFADNKSLTDAVTGASLVTFTRASSGTFVDSAGVIQTAATNVPRFDHNPTTLESLGLLVEEQRTNLLLRSEEFDNASWTKVRSTISANAIAAPDGTLTADKLVEDSTASNNHFLQQSYISVSGTYTFSVYLKAAERTQAYIGLSDGATALVGGIADFSAVTMATGGGGSWTNVSTGITPLANGWYRCRVTATQGAGAIVRPQVFTATGGTVTYTGDNTSGIFIWGAQLEAGAFPTSYIGPTTTAAVTRSADVASITGSAFSSWYRQDEGTVHAAWQFNAGAVSTTRHVCNFNDSLVDQFIGVFASGANTLSTNSFVAGISQGRLDIAGSPAALLPYKSATTYGAGNRAFTLNGVPPLSGTGSLPSATRLEIGYSFGSNFVNGTIRRLTFWPTRLSNASLQQITQ